MPSPWSMLMKSLDLKHASRLLSMGMKQNQAGGVLAHYFMGAQGLGTGAGMGGKAGLNVFMNQSRSPMLAAARIGTAATVGALGMSMLPDNDFVAGVGAAGAFYGAYKGLGAAGLKETMAKVGGTVAQKNFRGITGIAAGSIAWQGLRSPRNSDYTA